MKNIGIVYFIFLIMLSLLPCSDVAQIDQQSKISQANVSNEQHADNGFCSALCLCSCCGQRVVINAPLITPNVIVMDDSEQSVFETVQKISSHSCLIWQPPKNNI